MRSKSRFRYYSLWCISDTLNNMETFYVILDETLWVRSSIRIFCRISLRDRNRFSFSRRSTHRPTLQFYCAIIRGRKGLLLVLAGKCRERRFFSPRFSALLKSILMEEYNAVLAQFINGRIHRPSCEMYGATPVKSSGVVKCRLWPASGTPLSLLLLQ